MMHYFHRQVQLWGDETQRLLQDKKIVIIGSGGLGSSLVFALGASGIGEIHIVDFDEVSVHNIHRQIIFKVKFNTVTAPARKESAKAGEKAAPPAARKPLAPAKVAKKTVAPAKAKKAPAKSAKKPEPQTKKKSAPKTKPAAKKS